MSEQTDKLLRSLVERLRRHESLSEPEQDFLASQLAHGAAMPGRGPGRPPTPPDKRAGKTIRTAYVAEGIYYGNFPAGLSDVEPSLATAIALAKGSRTQADGAAADVLGLKGPSAVAKARARIFPSPQQRQRFRSEPMDSERWEEFKHLLRAQALKESQ